MTPKEKIFIAGVMLRLIKQYNDDGTAKERKSYESFYFPDLSHEDFAILKKLANFDF